MRVSSLDVVLLVVLLLSSTTRCLCEDDEIGGISPISPPTTASGRAFRGDTTEPVIFTSESRVHDLKAQVLGPRCEDCACFTGPCSRTLGGLDQTNATCQANTPPISACFPAHTAHDGRSHERGLRESMTLEGLVRGFRERISFACRLYATKPSQAPTRKGCGGSGITSNSGVPSRGSPPTPPRYRALDPANPESGAVHVLLGLPEATLQSPLHGRDMSFLHARMVRSRPPGEEPSPFMEEDSAPVAQEASRNGNERLESCFFRVMAAIRPIWARMRSYPWYYPGALARLFAVRVITIRFPVDPLVHEADAAADGFARSVFRGKQQGQGATRLSRAALFSEGSLKRLRIVSYPAVSVELEELTPLRQLASRDPNGKTSLDKIRLTCDFPSVLYTRAYLQRFRGLQDDPERTHSLKRRARTDEYIDEEEDQDYGRHVGVGGDGLLGRLLAGREQGLASGGVIRWICLLLKRFLGFSQRRDNGYVDLHSEQTDDFGEERDNGEAHIFNAGGDESHPRPSPQVMHEMKDFLSRLREELGPYQPHVQLWLPEWIQQLLGRRVLSVEKYIEERDRDQGSQRNASSKEGRRTITAATKSSQPKDFYFIWKATLPATQTTCLALAAVQSTRNRLDTASSLPIHLEESLVFDFLWLKLGLVLVGLRLFQVRMADSRLLRILFSAVYGSFILIILFVLHFVREFQALSVGRIGVVVILAVGGVAALAEVMLSAVGYVLANPAVLSAGMFSFLPLSLQELLRGLPGVVSWGIVLLFAGMLSSLLMHLFFSDRLLCVGARWGMHGLVVTNFLLLIAQNREATFLVLLLWYGGSFARTFWSCLMGVLKNERRAESNIPEENLPPAAHREIPFARPMTVESGRYLAWKAAIQKRDASNAQHGVSSSYGVQKDHKFLFPVSHRKISLYEEEGAAHTRRALEELAMQVRTNPEKYSQRLRDPNTVYQWAGVGVCDSESDISRDSK
ncbi:unnamed protein product [Phytomonas sp. EM1]|nr:unnamed protein product [Phytomonas sp. EM1]|eukprot:CCW63998.1 unnamed protein product [Phytomonas sp. isolate EM1]